MMGASDMGSQHYSPNHRARPNRTFIEININKALKDQGGNTSHWLCLQESFQAFLKRHRTFIFKGSQQANSVTQRGHLISIPQQVLGIPQSESVIDFFVGKQAIAGTLSLGLDFHHGDVHGWRTIWGINDHCAAIAIGDEKIRHDWLIFIAKIERHAAPGGHCCIDIEKTGSISRNL